MQGTGGRWDRKLLFTECRVLGWDDGTFWRWVVMVVYNSVNALNAIEMYNKQELECKILCYVYFTTR